jgi:hypothetical protein
MSEYFENAYLKIQKKDQFIHVVYGPDTRLTLEIAKDAVKERLKISNGVTLPMLIDIGGLVSVTKEARIYFASEEAIAHISKGAIVLKTSTQTVIGNFFLFFDRPKIETKLFHKEDEALKWLKK